jgi:hypothetical protein
MGRGEGCWWQEHAPLASGRQRRRLQRIFAWERQRKFPYSRSSAMLVSGRVWTTSGLVVFFHDVSALTVRLERAVDLGARGTAWI